MDALPELSASALALLETRYLRRDADGRVTGTAAELFDEVGAFVANAEDRYEAGSGALQEVTFGPIETFGRKVH